MRLAEISKVVRSLSRNPVPVTYCGNTRPTTGSSRNLGVVQADCTLCPHIVSKTQRHCETEHCPQFNRIAVSALKAICALVNKYTLLVRRWLGICLRLLRALLLLRWRRRTLLLLLLFLLLLVGIVRRIIRLLLVGIQGRRGRLMVGRFLSEWRRGRLMVGRLLGNRHGPSLARWEAVDRDLVPLQGKHDVAVSLKPAFKEVSSRIQLKLGWNPSLVAPKWVMTGY